MSKDQETKESDVSYGESGQFFYESSAGDAGLKNIDIIDSGRGINSAGEPGRFVGIDYIGPTVLQKINS